MNTASPEIAGELSPLMQMFKRWDRNKPPDSETVHVELTLEIKNDCRFLREKTRKITPGIYQNVICVDSQEIIVFFDPNLNLIPVVQKTPNDWTVKINFPEVPSFNTEIVMQIKEIADEEPTIRKVFSFCSDSDLQKTIPSYIFNHLSDKPTETSDYNYLLKILSATKDAMASVSA